MSEESFEPVEFEPLDEVEVKIEDGPLEGSYETYVDGIDRTQLHLRVPLVDHLYLPIGTGELITLSYTERSATYQCQIKIRSRKEQGAYPTITVPLPAEMKRIQLRKHVRVPCEIEVELFEFDEASDKVTGGPFNTTAVDISAGGIKLHHEKPLQKGTTVVMNFELPLIETKMDTVFGQVLRMFDEKAGEKFVSAITFSALTDEQRESIIQYTYKKQIELRNKGDWV